MFVVFVLVCIAVAEAQDVRKVYVHFSEGSTRIENFSEITRVAEFVGDDSRVEVVAHTSETGDFETNKRIADRRAENIKDALLKVVPGLDVKTEIAPYQKDGEKINATVGVVKILDPIGSKSLDRLSGKIDSLSNQTSMGQREIKKTVKDLKGQVLTNRDLADKQKRELLQELDKKVREFNRDLSQKIDLKVDDALESLQDGQKDIRDLGKDLKSGQEGMQKSMEKEFHWLKYAIIGLAIGIILVLIGVAFLVFRSRKTGEQQPAQDADEGQSMNFPKKMEDIADMFFNKKYGDTRASCPYCQHAVYGRNYLTHLRKSCPQSNPLKGKTHEEAKQELSGYTE
jgi:hypothetical protein